jgi:hypothetical protein
MNCKAVRELLKDHPNGLASIVKYDYLELAVRVAYYRHMSADSLDLSAIVSEVVDLEDSESELPNAAGKGRARKDGKRGRAAFAADICEAHGGNSETPCYKFAHLPGNGRGPYRPSATRKARSFGVSLIKPVVLIGIVLGALYAGKVFLPNLFSMHSFAPTSGVSGNANGDGNNNGNGNSNGNSNGNLNRNGNGQRSGNGSATTGLPQFGPAYEIGDSGYRAAIALGIHPSRIGA